MKPRYGKTGNVYHHGEHFLKDVGSTIGFDWEPLGIEPDTFIGTFFADRLPELRKFCKENPDFHIFSMTDEGVFLNYAAPNVSSYYLGDGDANPRLVAKDIVGMRFLAGSASNPFFTEGE